MQKAKPRIEELDFLKCVFITLMIAFHLVYIGNTYPVAKQLVYTFHMPGFLLVSGYLFNVDKPWTAFGKTLLWIFIPYAMMETGYTVMASLLPIREHIDHLTPGLIVDHVFLHPMGPYWYLHTLMLCGACYYFAFRKPRGRFAQSVRRKSRFPESLMSRDNQWLLGRFSLLALFLWLLSHGCGLLSTANAAYFFTGAVIRHTVGDFRRAFPISWWTLPLLIVWCLDTSHYHKESLAGACIVYLVVCSLLWIYRLQLPRRLRRLSLFPCLHDSCQILPAPSAPHRAFRYAVPCRQCRLCHGRVFRDNVADGQNGGVGSFLREKRAQPVSRRFRPPLQTPAHDNGPARMPMQGASSFLYPFLLHRFPVQRIGGEDTVLIGHEGRGIPTFRECDGTEIADKRIVLACKFPKVRMSIDDRIDAAFRHRHLIIYMPMGKEESPALVNKHQVVCHHRELQQHLVDLRITVSTYSHNVSGTSVQRFDNSLGIDSFWNGIARTVVQNVPENAKHIAMRTVVEPEHFLECRQTTVDV